MKCITITTLYLRVKNVLQSEKKSGNDVLLSFLYLELFPFLALWGRQVRFGDTVWTYDPFSILHVMKYGLQRKGLMQSPLGLEDGCDLNAEHLYSI